jgi:hypothetical protein
VPALTEYMDFMKNAKEDIILNSGKLSLTVSTVYPLQQLLMKKYFVCTEDFLQN